MGLSAFVRLFDMSCFMLVFDGWHTSLGYSMTWAATTSELNRARLQTVSIATENPFFFCHFSNLLVDVLLSKVSYFLKIVTVVYL